MYMGSILEDDGLVEDKGLEEEERGILEEQQVNMIH